MAMPLWQAVIMGVVEGVTEYLPVSSTGHLILTERALGVEDGEGAKAYAVVIQSGAILAVLGLYSRRVKSATLGLLGRDESGKKLAINLIAAFIPVMILGLTLNKFIKAYLFGMAPTSFAWFAGGALILMLSWRKPGEKSMFPPLDDSRGFELEELPVRSAVIIGLWQAVAMWPGTSRSLVTILVGVFVGLKLRAALEFSFLLGVITLTAATVHDAYKSHAALTSEVGVPAIVVGLITSWIAAALAVKWLVGYLQKHGLEIFGYYRVGLALVVVILMMLGIVKN